jgi:hypothetical protein
MKNLFTKEKIFNENKNFCFQIYWEKPSLFSFLKGSLKLFCDDYYFKVRFSFFGDCLDFYAYWNRKMDHAGLWYIFKILGLTFHFEISDTRHWDFVEDNWKNTYYTEKVTE